MDKQSVIRDLGITSDVQLRDFASRMGMSLNFIGFAEELKSLPEGINIINLGDEIIGGTHWTLLLVGSRSKQVVYFDSYGVGPEDRIIQLTPKGWTIYYSKKQIQGYSEQHCGIWALMGAKHIWGKKNMPQALEDFLSDYKTA